MPEPRLAIETPKELARSLERAYGLRAEQTVLLTRSVNDTYRVESRDGTYFLRLYSPNPYYQSTDEDFRFELELLAHLKGHGVAVANPTPTRDGQLLSELELSGGRRSAALFARARGAVHKAWWPRIDDEDAVRELGALLARMHLVADTFSTTHSRYTFDLHYLLTEPLRLLDAWLASHGRSGESAFFSDTARAIADVVNRLGNGPDTTGIIHGDAHVGNIFFDKDAGFTLLDFDHCAHGWRVYDLVPFLVTLRMNVDDDRIVLRVSELVRQGYEAVRPLSDAEREAIPAFEVLWHLWDIGETLALSSTFGGPVEEFGGNGSTERSPDAYIDRVLRTFEQLRARFEA